MTVCHTNFIFECSDLPSYTFICPGEELGTQLTTPRVKPQLHVHVIVSRWDITMFQMDNAIDGIYQYCPSSMILSSFKCHLAYTCWALTRLSCFCQSSAGYAACSQLRLLGLKFCLC